MSCMQWVDGLQYNDEPGELEGDKVVTANSEPFFRVSECLLM